MIGDIVSKALNQACKDLARDMTPVTPLEVELRLIEASWTLRRLPDSEARFIYTKQTWWPETHSDKRDYAEERTSEFMARLKSPPTAEEIDRMQPALDLLQMLPHIDDRRLVERTVYHQTGVYYLKKPWNRVKEDLALDHCSRTLKRKYDEALNWLAICLKNGKYTQNNKNMLTMSVSSEE